MTDSFLYRGFRISPDRRTVDFDYTISRAGDEHNLTESLTFPLPLKDTPQQLAGLRALHLALGVSYYKIFLPPAIEQPYAMDEAEAGFWNEVWQNGLGEFLYVNKLPVEQLAKFTAQDGEKYEIESSSDRAEGTLLGIGGGKDSIVAGELLKALEVPVTGFVMATGEQRGQAQAVANTMGVPMLAVNRVLDKQLLTLQGRPEAYRGHIPISLIFGLVGTTLAIASDKTYVVVANEASASIPRVTWQERAVNHQWSKSFGFEQTLQRYIQEHIAPSVTYFSAIRQLTSVGVAKLFANYQQYFEVFTSDNFVFRIDSARRPNGRWSLESPKSLSSFMLLLPWISEADMLRIFGRNFLDEPSLEPLFLALTGQEGEPPLDCVGTVEELVLSLNLAAQQGKFVDSKLMQLGRERQIILEKDWQSELQQLLALQADHALPSELAPKITDSLRRDLAA